jgi:hypothetical protein
MAAPSDRLIGRAALLLSILLVIVFATTVGRLAGRRALESLGWISPSTTAYAVGATIDLPEAVYRQTPFTVVLFARSDCPACQTGEPFYRSVAAFVGTHPTARMVLSSPVAGAGGAPAIEEMAYARRLGDGVVIVPWTSDQKPRVAVVPTLVMVNDRGVVLAAWQGAPAAGDRTRMMDVITKTIAR